MGFGEYEDDSTVDIVANDVVFGYHLNAYGKETSQNPIAFTVNPNIADSRHVRLTMTVSCDEATVIPIYSFTIAANNMVEIGGIISEDMTLTANHTYHVTSSIAIQEGATLTIEPGTRLEFDADLGISSFGKLIAKGEPGRMIVLTSHGEAGWQGINTSVNINSYYDENYHESVVGIGSSSDSLFYCRIENINYGRNSSGNFYMPYMEDCIITNLSSQFGWFYVDHIIGGLRNNFINNYDIRLGNSYQEPMQFEKSNLINNVFSDVETRAWLGWRQIKSLNYFNNYSMVNEWSNYKSPYSFMAVGYNKSDETSYVRNSKPSYLGTTKEEFVRPYIFEIGNTDESFSKVDLSNMLTEPVCEAHGIVWKVVVNGYDAQDEYEQLPPLGVGQHKFEVYFNRPMNKEVTPKISFGVRSPYTQHGVDENGSWNEEGTIYTAYFTITGKTQSDGVNRIYVYGAEDNEYFECPYENTRFNINIQAAGSLSAGFFGEAGMGRVTLQWDDADQNSGDVMGYNIYRYQYHSEERMVTDENGSYIWDNETGNWKMETIQVADTIRLTQTLLDAETREYNDYDVLPGETYHYFYQVMSTDMSESGRSHTVAVTPLTSTLGDANGSGDVDVADVISIVNYASNGNPKPFIYEAADMNTDQQIDILDIIGVIHKILNPNEQSAPSITSTAVYSVEDGILYIDSSVDLAGIQVLLSLDGRKDIKVSDDLTGFEHSSAWLSDNDYLFLAYSMSGKTLTAGKHALLYIGDAQVNSLRLSDAQGHNVTAVAGNTTAVTRMGSDVMNVKGIYTLGGQKLSGKASDLKKLPKGIYIINGEKIVK